MLRIATIVVLCLNGSLLIADDAETATSQQRMAGMRQRAEALQLKIGGTAERLRVGKEPALRYSEPTGTTTDGTLWLWTQAERPIAVASLFNTPQEGFQWNYELVSLTDSALFVDGRPGWNWRPTANVRKWIIVTEPEPARSEVARLVQMKELLAKFHAEEDLDGNVRQLRLLPRPIYRYRCPDEKIEDGAMFAFVFGTNPEALVQIEALADINRSWRISFARMASPALKVTRDEKAVWDAERVRSWNPQHEYFSHYGQDRGEVDREISP